MMRIVVFGASGYVGSAVVRSLVLNKLDCFPFPGFRELTKEQMRLCVSEDKFIAINCSGRTAINVPLFEENVTSVEKIIGAFKDKISLFIQISSTNIDNQSGRESYVLSKMLAETFLIKESESYGFSLQLLRLPTLWSANSLKRFSLLDAIIKSQKAGKDFVPVNPNQIIQITTENTFSSLIIDSLNLVNTNLRFDESNSWKGEVNELCKLLMIGSKSDSSMYLKHLEGIYLSWLNREIYYHEGSALNLST